MSRITRHPILDIPESGTVTFTFRGQQVEGRAGYTIAAALHNAGFPVHSHSRTHRNRSLECGIGKCGACEMLVNGRVRRICITLCDGVKQVEELPEDRVPAPCEFQKTDRTVVYKTTVAIIGAGPAGLAAREVLRKHNVPVLVIDNQPAVGGQFLMQTHQFFFFEREQRLGGKRGFEIPSELCAGDDEGIILNSTVWDLLEGNRLAVKNIRTDEVFYVDSQYLIVAAGAVPFLPPFENDDVPGVYSAAVVQKMMNTELTLLGKRVLTVGAGNIGYLTSYQLVQAGAEIAAIIEMQGAEGGFPVQANRVRRLGIPILTSTVLLKAVPNEAKDGIVAAVVAEFREGAIVPGSERVIENIDMINICTGLVSDNQLLTKGREIFGTRCFGAGDSIRIGEGTTAVLKGAQAAYEILDSLGADYDYAEYLKVSKEYIDSQQHPIPVLDAPKLPDEDRRQKPFVVIDCLYGFACNPCAFACPFGAIVKSSTSTVPRIRYDKCTGCMRCVTLCPGLAIFGFDLRRRLVYLPMELDAETGAKVTLVDNDGNPVGEGVIEAVRKQENRTNLCVVHAGDDVADILNVRGVLTAPNEPLSISPLDGKDEHDLTFLCHCSDVGLEEVMEVIGDRRFISVDEIKHNTRLGMGACRGKRCFSRLRQVLRGMGIEIIGRPTPRAPLSNQVTMGEVFPTFGTDDFRLGSLQSVPTKKKVDFLIAGGGIGGSSLFRYMSEAGLKPTVINYGTGATWRNIAAGRSVFSLPELSEIARCNLQLYSELQERANIDFRLIEYVTFAHDQNMVEELERSMAWQDAEMVVPADFKTKITPHFNEKCESYLGALKTRDCWQANPGKTVDLLRRIGVEAGGTVHEDCELLAVIKDGDDTLATVRMHNDEIVEYRCKTFINALGPGAYVFARQLGVETGLYPVKHQAFITRRLPFLGIGDSPLSMLIDRKPRGAFSAVYGQQLVETGQIIGCASPRVDPLETDKDLQVNSREFLQAISEVFVNWLPCLSSVGFQAAWAGYYVEPRMIIDPAAGLFVGLRGQGFMLSQYLAKLYVDVMTGRDVPDYFSRLSLDGDGLQEKSFR